MTWTDYINGGTQIEDTARYSEIGPRQLSARSIRCGDWIKSPYESRFYRVVAIDGATDAANVPMIQFHLHDGTTIAFYPETMVDKQ